MMWTIPASRRIVYGLLALLMVVPLACKKAEEHGEEGEEEHAAPVKWEPAEKAELEEWTQLLGITQPLPDHVARISAPIEGHVVSLLTSENGKAIVEGQRVEKGQVIVRLDDRVLRANREKLLVSDPELQEQIKQAEHAVELTRIEIERLQRLQTNSGSSVPLVTRLEMDKANLALKDAESKLKGVRAKENIANAELKAIDEQLALYTMRAPLAGQLSMVHAVAGQTLSAGTTVAEVINLDEIDVLCFVPANTVSRLKLEQEVRIEEEGETITDAVKLEVGHIVFIAEQAQADTGTVAVKARFPNKERRLRGNTLVRARVLTEKKSNCLTIPEAALLEDQEEPAVLVIETEKKKDKHGEEKEEHHVHKLQAKLGLRDREKHRVEILGLFKVEEEKKKPVALEDDTLFVVEGGHGLENDDLVTLKKEEHEEEKKDEHKEEKKDEHKEEKKDEK